MFRTLCFLLLCSPLMVAADDINFTRDIRPILSGKCFKCHGPDAETREGGLRLDLQESAFGETDSGELGIVAGHPERSAIIERVTSEDEYLRMPPVEQGDALSKEEVELLTRWIKQGAEYEPHWSFVVPRRPELPKVSEPGWCQNPIDYFVLAQLDAKGYFPSPEADRYTLARRLYLDLTGIPPTVAQVDAFVNDPRPDAYERLVDELLASPAYGERWARVWLDLARYADSAGYADDPPRVIWMYRDWVIEAINAGMPFDEFTRLQLAGDLRQEPTEEELIATAFHRNTMTNSEGGTDDEEFRTAAIVDRVNTTMQVWMGLTMGCAQCHTHKYDPITQEDYFRVYAILNQTEDADRRNEAPVLNRYTESQLLMRETLRSRLKQLQQERRRLEEELENSNKELKPLPPNEARFVRLELPGEKKMVSLAEVQVFVGETNVAPQGEAKQSSTDYSGPANLAIDGNTDGHFFDAQSTTHTKVETDPWWEVDLGQRQVIERVVIWNRTDATGIGKRLDGVQLTLLDEQRQTVYAREIAKAPVISQEIKVPTSLADLSVDEKSLLAEKTGRESPELIALSKQIEQLNKRIGQIQPIPTPIMKELAEDQQRKTHIQIRGNFLDLGPEVEPGVIESFHGLETPKPNRADLAEWILSDENPLTARVIANRYWEKLFGLGLVVTSEDFGMQGELPSHPRLLDWLAVELRESWDTKQLVKLIVTSATYRQSSDVTSELAQVDPFNQLLARGPRFRLPAERVRDNALAIGGLLSRKMYGESVKPPRPVLGLRAAFGGSTDWKESAGEDRFRRGLYTFWRRSMPYPSMDAFDAPSREVCTMRRIRTNTPLQALVTLNDPVYLEAAQGLAHRVLDAELSTDEERMTRAFRICVARPPSAEELETLQSVLDNARQTFTNEPEMAKQMAELLPRTGRVASEIAAWTVVANVLLNLDETLVRR